MNKIKAKESLGQNFLKSKNVAKDIIRAADLDKNDVVLEVGPGKGILTEELVKKAGKVIAVEKDKRLVDYLNKKFESIPKSSDRRKVAYSTYPGLEIINDDILKFNPRRFKLQVSGFKIVANIPYYITSHFLRKFLELDIQPSKMVLMVQKEVAERIVGEKRKNLPSSIPVIKGKDSRRQVFSSVKESILSISIKAYGEPRIIRSVSRKYFSPQPKVDSAILLIDNISKNFFKNTDEKKFFSLVRKGFSNRRKMLKNNLKCGPEVFKKCKISENARAENLSLSGWNCLLQFFK